MIRRIAASYERNPQLAQELMQDILLALWIALPSFRGASSLRTFVARIAVNRAISHVKRAMKLPPTAALSKHLVSCEAGPEAKTIARDQQARLLGAVRRLPLAFRQVLVLALEGLSPADIAAALGISANAVTIRLSRAKHILRQQMGADSEHD